MTSGLRNLSHDISYKRRSLDQLAEYLINRTDNAPNYSILLGAGCSVTSGIRPASELVKEWKKEIFFGSNKYEKSHDEELTESSINEFFKSDEVAGWYDPRNEYACLFEYKYNLQRQRRQFVEREVCDKYPSIGYAYLMQLVKKIYVNTLFTTNFDDLLAESFYQYSDVRPVVCAHDSSITSITVTSQRPKIIKLHGDYLFDDIKSTVRETESLEDNMKNKFIEFAKDHGLIVVGYAGNDRSIMDILLYLLKQEQYFKHGLYWCLRRSTPINNELKKLLSQDKVFFVEIDGFDEMMAFLNDKINNGNLPVDTYTNTKKAIAVIEKLTSNDYLITSNSKTIKRDLEDLKRRTKIDTLEIAMDMITDDDSTSENAKYDGIAARKNKISRENRYTLERVSFLRKTEQYEDALEIINNEIENTESDDTYKEELYRREASIHLDQGEKQKAISCYEKQLHITAKNVAPLLNMARIADKYEDRIAYIDRALTIDSNDWRVYAEKGAALYEYYNMVSQSESNKVHLELVNALDEGIRAFPAVGNVCYEIKFNQYARLYKLTSNKEMLKECIGIVNALEEQNPYAPEVVKLRVSLLLVQNRHPSEVGFYNQDEMVSYLDSVIRSATNKNLASIKAIEIDFFARTSNRDKVIHLISQYEKLYGISQEYVEIKSRALLSACDNLSDSISTLEAAVNGLSYSQFRTRLATYYMYFGEMEKAKEIVFGVEKLNKELMELYFYYSCDYLKALSLHKEINEHNSKACDVVITESFYLLKLEKYEEAMDLINNVINLCQPDSMLALHVNYELARIGMGKKIRTSKLREVSSDEKISLEQAAIHLLLGDKEKAICILQKCINSNYERRYVIKHWVVFNDLIEDPRYQDIIGHAEIKNIDHDQF